MFVARVGTLNSRGGVRAVAVRVFVLVAANRRVDVARAPDAWGRREPSALLGPACETKGRRFRNRSERYHKRILISGRRLGKGRTAANDAPRKPAATGRIPDTVRIGVCKARAKTTETRAATTSSRENGLQGRGEYRHLVRPERRHRIDGWKQSASEPLPT